MARRQEEKRKREVEEAEKRIAAMLPDFGTFVDRKDGDYRAALVLLAINVGYADVAPRIMADLETASKSNFSTWLLETFPKNKKEDLARLQKQIESVKNELLNRSLQFDDNLDSYKQWAPEVGRYSFHCHSMNL